jgi:drug/metabolite transporter (DMT)-like permease
MIEFGVVLLIIGLILWGVGSVVAPRPPARALIVAGQVVGGIGLILLLVGIALLLIPGLTGADNPEIDVDSMRALIGI